MEASVSGRFQRKRAVAHRRIQGQTVVVLPRDGRVVVLNGTGGDVWELTDGTRDAQEIASVIAERYGVTSDSVLLDVEQLYAELLDVGAIEPIA